MNDEFYRRILQRLAELLSMERTDVALGMLAKNLIDILASPEGLENMVGIFDWLSTEFSTVFEGLPAVREVWAVLELPLGILAGFLAGIFLEEMVNEFQRLSWSGVLFRGTMVVGGVGLAVASGVPAAAIGSTVFFGAAFGHFRRRWSERPTGLPPPRRRGGGGGGRGGSPPDDQESFPFDYFQKLKKKLHPAATKAGKVGFACLPHKSKHVLISGLNARAIVCGMVLSKYKLIESRERKYTHAWKEVVGDAMASQCAAAYFSLESVWSDLAEDCLKY